MRQPVVDQPDAVREVGGFGARRVNTRIIVATNRPLSGLVGIGRFRPDLYYRLSGVEIHVPPLRDRANDVVELARYFLARHRQTRALALAPEAEEALRVYHWPGNVRELERLIERAVALVEAERIELDDLPPHVRRDYVDVLAPSPKYATQTLSFPSILMVSATPAAIQVR